jgi:hypothetical protein
MSRFAPSLAGVGVLVLLCTSTLWSQIAPPVATRPGRQPRVEPCWKQVGISKAAMEERAAISRETRSQIEAVCANSSLTPQQRQQQIRQIHEQAKPRMEALVSPQQQEALRACQQSRAANHPPAPGVHRGGGTGPCGELATTHPSGQPARPPNTKPEAEKDSSPQN